MNINYKNCWLTLNRECNLRCRWCYAKSEKYKTSSDMDINMAYKIVDICDLLGIRHITLIGGEPTLYSHLFEIIEYINKKKIKWGFVTNGLILSDDMFTKRLIDSGIKHFSISLKGENKEVFKAITGKNALPQVIDGIRNCAKHGANVNVSMVLMEENIKTYLEGIRLMKDNGANTFRLSFCYDFSTTTGDRTYLHLHNPKALIKGFMDSYEQLDEITEHKFILSQTFPMCLWDKSFIKMLDRKNQISSVCQLLKKSGLIFDQEGYLIPCNAMYKIKLGKLGNDFNTADELIRYVNKDSIQCVYKKLCSVPDKKCLYCSEYKNCGGGCVCQWTNYDFNALMNREI